MLFVALSYARALHRHNRRVCPSVRPSHAGIDSKLISVRSRSFHQRLAQKLVFDTNFHTLDGREPSLRWLQTRLGRVKRRKDADVRPINRYIPETIEHGYTVTVEV